MGVLRRHPHCSQLPDHPSVRERGRRLDSSALGRDHQVGLFPPSFSPPSELAAARGLPPCQDKKQGASHPQCQPGKEEVEARAGEKGEALKALRRKRDTGQRVHGVALWAPEVLEAQAPRQQIPHRSPTRVPTALVGSDSEPVI